MEGMTGGADVAEFDLNDPLFKTDAFMVYGFKVLPCRRTRRHDWRECPFAHPGEVARRRDPRVYTYVGIICPDAKQNSPCPRGDRCPYTHSLFEYWLHPTRYKTEFCSRGRNCTRPFCFFAHSETEMRPVDTEALLAVAMGPQPDSAPLMSLPPPSNLPIDDAVLQTADLLQKAQFFDPPLRSQSFSGDVRSSQFSPGLGRTIRSENDTTLLLRSSTLASPWDTIYENGSLDSAAVQLDLQRRYSASDAVNSNDVISRLGLGYLQQSAKQRLLQQECNGLGGAGGVPLDASSMGRSGSKSWDAYVWPSASDAQLQAYLTERGGILPTSLPHGSFF